MPTFSHGTEGVLVGIIGAHAAWPWPWSRPLPGHLRGAHARLVARVGGHGVSPGEGWVTTVRKGVLEAHTAPRRGEGGGLYGDKNLIRADRSL